MPRQPALNTRLPQLLGNRRGDHRQLRGYLQAHRQHRRQPCPLRRADRHGRSLRLRRLALDGALSGRSVRPARFLDARRLRPARRRLSGRSRAERCADRAGRGGAAGDQPALAGGVARRAAGGLAGGGRLVGGLALAASAPAPVARIGAAGGDRRRAERRHPPAGGVCLHRAGAVVAGRSGAGARRCAPTDTMSALSRLRHRWADRRSLLRFRARAAQPGGLLRHAPRRDDQRRRGRLDSTGGDDRAPAELSGVRPARSRFAAGLRGGGAAARPGGSASSSARCCCSTR